ncbi:hypothetical protein [Halarcobacter sp.]|uniref:hypothetical protein n=1 Tax=Halarcobacter sp. TaxID=2321133 RepID=UPI0029F50222|nr:hypothetical protein [Halarcobacter sp.]
MRLKEIEKILEDIELNNVRLDIQNLHLSSPELINIDSFKFFLETIEIIDIYKDEIDYIKQSKLYQTTHRQLTLPKKEALDIYNKAKYLIDSAQSLQLVFKKLLPKSNEQSISIKLPEPLDFDSLIKTMATFQKSISQVIINEDINGTLKINHWEFGSFWLELFLGTQAAVALISSIAWSAAVISKKFNENKLLEQTVKSMEIKNESLEDILDSQKKMTNMLIENEAQAILDKHFDSIEHEQLERLKSTIKTFAKLIQDGAEVHPSLMAPEKIKNLFPDYKNLDVITSQIKQIENKSE